MKNLLLGLIFTMFAMQANAATFDFLAIANTGEYGAPSIDFSVGDLDLTASAGLDNAYLDSGDAGLGVCKSLTSGAQCLDKADDNVTFGEVLKLEFNKVIKLGSIALLNGKHGTSFIGDIDISVDGGAYVGYALNNVLALGLTGQSFMFANNNAIVNAEYKQDFYISSLTTPSAVPVPAAVWLFGSALIGLFGASRRKSTAVAA